MKKYCYSCGLLFTILLLINEVVFAQSQFVEFKSLVERGVAYNKVFINDQLENEKTALDREEIKGKLLPNISATGLYGYLNTGTKVDVPTHTLPFSGLPLFEGTTTGNFSTQMGSAGLLVKQVIFSGLQITNAQKALEQKYKAQALLSESAYDSFAQEIVLSLDQIMLLKEVELLIDDSEKRLNKEHLKVVKAIENGFAIPYDRDKIKLAMLELENKRAEVESNRELLLFKLEELTGLAIEELKSISYSLNSFILNENETVMHRKELAALEATQKAYEFMLKKEKGAKLPQFFAFGNVSYISSFGTNFKVNDLPVFGDVKFKNNSLQFAPLFAVGVGAKWSIFEGKTHSARIEKAKIDLEINANKIQDTKEKLSLLQRKTKADYELATKRIRVNEQQMLIAKNNLKLATRQFEEGLQDVTERLEAENEYYKQSLNYFYQILSQRSAATEVLKANGNLYHKITGEL